MSKVLVVDDNQSICFALAATLESCGHDIETALSGEDAKRLLAITNFDVVLTDISMPGMTGIDLLDDVQRANPDTSVLIMTGDPTIETVTQALHGGAFDYLVKPIRPEEVKRAVNQAAGVKDLKAQKRQLERDNLAYQQRLEQMVEKRTNDLRNSEARLAGILSVAPVGIYVSQGGVIRDVNPAFCAMLGYTKEELLGSDEQRLYPSTEQHNRFHGERAHAIAKDGVARLMVTMQRKDGGIRHIHLQAALMISRSDAASLTLIAQDMTEQFRLQAEHDQSEAALRQAQKMTAIGLLAAGIAHEINSPSQFVLDNLRFMRDSFLDLQRLLSADESLRASALTRGDPLAEAAAAIATSIDIGYLSEEIPKSLSQSMEGMERIRKIVLAMKEFSHPTETKMPADLNHLIENALIISHSEWKYVATATPKLDRGLPEVNCIPSEISQVLLNLIVNASHAIAESLPQHATKLGAIDITTTHTEKWAEIRIGDNGCGVAPNILERIFEPFFTTKAIGKGTGQGLALAWSVIVDKHFGTLALESQVGVGTVFIIRLPISGEKSDL